MLSEEGPRVLYLDIETAPNLVYTWGLFNQNVSIEKIHTPGHVLCWAAKREGAEEPMYWSGLHQHGRQEMLEAVHYLMAEADMIVHYNGHSFDIPTLNAEFVQLGMHPPAPYKQIDLLKTVQKMFRFPSSKLDYVAQALGIGEKVKHPGFQLWLDCMAGQEEAWQLMRQYNEHDVTLLEGLYKRIQPWVPYHPTRALTERACPSCGSLRLHRRGSYLAKTRTYQRYRCAMCGAWSRSITSDKARAVVTSISA